MLEQRKLIEAVKEKAQADPRVAAVWMYGSFTQGEGDAYSDVEFYIYVQDDAYPDFGAEEWIAGVHPIYTHFFNEFGTQVVIFKNMVRGEFHIHPASEMATIAGYGGSVYAPDIDSMCLCDKTGALRRHLQALEGTAFAPTNEMAQAAVDNLINNLLFGWSVYRRGELARSLELLWYIQRYYLQLIRIAQNKMTHWINPTRLLERELAAETYGDYIQCTAGLNNLRDVMRQLCAQGFALKDYTELLQELEQFLNGGQA